MRVPFILLAILLSYILGFISGDMKRFPIWEDGWECVEYKDKVCITFHDMNE